MPTNRNIAEEYYQGIAEEHYQAMERLPSPPPAPPVGAPAPATTPQDTYESMRGYYENPDRVFVRHDPYFHKGFNRHPHSHRFMAAEMEVCGSIKESAVRFVADRWSASVVSDGSLPSTGFEVNTSPASGHAFLKQLEEFEQAFKLGRTTTNGNCGCHVHIDCRDLTYNDMRRLVFLWMPLEKLLYSVVSQTRRDNRFCQPIGKTYVDRYFNSNGGPSDVWKSKSKNGFFRAAYGQEPSRDTTRANLSTSKSRGNRYVGLNLHSWMYRGTIENRMHQGTTSAKDIFNWGRLNCALMDLSQTMKDPEVNAFYSKYNKLSVAPALLHKELGISQELVDWVEQRIKKNGEVIY
jgi:hypothetical protein